MMDIDNRNHEPRFEEQTFRPDFVRFKPRNPNSRTPLPPDFFPLPYSVIIGRGKLGTHNVGNRRLRILASTFVSKYSQARSKVEKTTTVSQIVEIIQEACPVGAFIKLANGQWWEVDDHTAREKVGYVLRDLLDTKYRSSSKSKVARRRSQQLANAKLSATKAGQSSTSTAGNECTKSANKAAKGSSLLGQAFNLATEQPVRNEPSNRNEKNGIARASLPAEGKSASRDKKTICDRIGDSPTMIAFPMIALPRQLSLREALAETYDSHSQYSLTPTTSLLEAMQQEVQCHNVILSGSSTLTSDHATDMHHRQLNNFQHEASLLQPMALNEPVSHLRVFQPFMPHDICHVSERDPMNDTCSCLHFPWR